MYRVCHFVDIAAAATENRQRTERLMDTEMENSSSSRKSIVDGAREKWKQKLFDLGRRNTLLYFRDLKKGSLRLNNLKPSDLETFLGGSLLDVAQCAGDDRGLVLAKAQEIRNQAVTNLEEKGIRTCYVGLGLASWKSPDGGRPPSAPVWLVPAEIEFAGREGHRAHVRKNGDLQLNPVMVYALEDSFGVRLIPEDEDDIPWGSLDARVAKMQEQARDVPDFSLDPAVIVGNFSFQKLAMVSDLTELGDALADNDVIAALAGDSEARLRLFPPHSAEVEDTFLDDVPPDGEFTVLDADSSQMRVIRAVGSGKTGVILGPPGTGKSQTIVNILAESAAEGKSVLFVAEKRAALDVVLGRLHDVGLEHLALDLEGAARSKNSSARLLGDSLERIRRAEPVSTDTVHEVFSERRTHLNAYVRALHAPRAPLDMSVFSLLGAVLQTPEPLRLPLRLPPEVLLVFTPQVQRAVEEDLQELGALDVSPQSPWTTMRFTTESDVQDVLALVGRLGDHWLRFRSAGRHSRDFEEFLSRHPLDDLAALLEFWNETAMIRARYHDTLFASDIDAVEKALRPLESTVSALLHHLTDSQYRWALRQMKGYGISARAPEHPLNDLRQVQALRAQWQAWGYHGVPDAPKNLPEMAELWPGIARDMETLSHFGLDVRQMPVEHWDQTLRHLVEDRLTPLRLYRIYTLEQKLSHLSLGTFLQELKLRQTESKDWVAAFYAMLRHSALDAAFSQEAGLATFTRSNHERIIQEFGQSDRRRIELNRARVTRAHAQRAVNILNKYPQQESLVRQEAAKKSRHLSVRKLLQQAPEAVLALRPIWVASPLNVSQLLAARTVFDVVIFDEASQVLPEDAVPSLARGKQAVVAGDNHQLPPTMFFATTGEEGDNGDEGSAYEGFESVLDLMSGLTAPWTLEWHYRSRDERLIAFSNHHIYGDRLVTFPGCGHLQPLRLQLVVPQGPSPEDGSDSVADEATKVVEEILQHAADHPSESLGVITMGLRHANRIQMALDEALRGRPDLDDFFDAKRPDRFFIKNLERVQGDERDVIILSIGYGKDRTGHLPYRFGPLLQEGGERRLNVAVTRARSRMIVVASFDHRDMDPERKMSRGVSLLREFLSYASSGGQILSANRPNDAIALNAFELSVRDALQDRGLDLVAQWGVSRYRLDFAVKHPQRPGQFVLAIECDGATYHSAPNARDRDRLRQQQLEALGWKFHRIWSTEWFRNPAGEADRAAAVYHKALQATDGPPPPAEAPEGLQLTAPAPPGPGRRGAQPAAEQGIPIDQRSSAEILEVLDWIQSDGLLRTDGELMRELAGALGYKRRGQRIEEQLRQVIQRHRQEAKATGP